MISFRMELNNSSSPVPTRRALIQRFFNLMVTKLCYIQQLLIVTYYHKFNRRTKKNCVLKQLTYY